MDTFDVAPSIVIRVERRAPYIEFSNGDHLVGVFEKQVVVCLASNLNNSATAIANKDHADARSSVIVRYGDWTGGMPTRKLSALGENYDIKGMKSRLVVLAHGDPTSSGINGRAELTGKKLAQFVGALLEERIGRITLHMCYGGGHITRRGDWETPSSSPTFSVSPWDSIACDFASHAGGLAAQVTARTDVVSGSYNDRTLKGFKRTVGGSSEKRMGDKVLFRVDSSSSLSNSVRPRISFVTSAGTPS